jgi:DNA-binding beta-propeller fold protein YncE
MNPIRHIAAAALTATAICLLMTSSATGADSVYWGSFGAGTLSRANIGEGGGADIPIAPPGLVDGPWGVAIDSAVGKIYWANENSSSIGYANLDGSGGALLNIAGATVNQPNGLAIDPVAGRIYWPNFSANQIFFANLNGSGGGQLSTVGATVQGPSGVAVDRAGGRLYWTNYGASKISFANLDGSGAGGDLDTSGALVEGPEGLAIDASANRIYWANYTSNTIGFASLNGGAGGQLDTGGAIVDEPAGIAIDPFANRAYWANIGNGTIVYASLTGAGAGQIGTSGATTSGIGFPVLQQRPRNLELPTIQGPHRPGATLNCTQGRWRGDLLESFLYLAPRSYAYQWFRNGQTISGATAASTVAGKVGTYSCATTATNFAGSDSALSGVDFSVNATVGFKKVTFNRKKGTATLRVAVTGAGRLDLYGVGVANAQRKRASGIAKIIVRSSGKARIKLANTGKAKVKARISYTPEGGTAIKRFKSIVLKKRPG